MPITRTCRISGKEFIITDREITFLDKISPIFGWKKYPLWVPTLCSEERMRRRLSWRNWFTLYKATCPLSWRSIITTYSPSLGYLGTDQETWWTQVEWLDYGEDYDFGQSFFEQYNTLLKKTPLPCVSNSYTINQNAEYVHGTINVQNCYLIFNSSNNEYCEYAETVNRSTFIFDSSYVFESSHCYDSIGITRCYNCISVEESEDCSESYFLYDCRGCDHCILCDWLENQSYCIKNKKVTPEEYEIFLNSIWESDGTIQYEALKDEFLIRKNSLIQKDHIVGSENCSGRFIKFSKDVINGKNLTWVEDTMNTWQMNYVTRCYDCFSWGGWTIGSPGAENCYECQGIWSWAYGLIWCWWVWENTRNMYYSYSCIGCQDCFGCVWLRNKQYCILNIQYEKQEYEKLAWKIIDRMIQNGEWGEYPPSSMSTFTYNETVANLEFPLTQDEANEKWYKWNTYENPFQEPEKIIPWSKLPHKISDIPDDILSWAIKCEDSGKYYKITRPELEFYRKHRLPIPRKHYDVRRKERFDRRSR